MEDSNQSVNEDTDLSTQALESPRPAHPEGFCEHCGRVNVVWFAPSPIWNKVVREPNGGADVMLCPTCFVQLAEIAGIRSTGWAVIPERSVGDFRESATELAEWIGIHPKWSRESLIFTIESALADAARVRAIAAAKEIVAQAINVTERDADTP